MARTAKYRLCFWIAAFLSLLLNVGPLVVYSVGALCSAELITEKVALCMTVFVVLIMTVISMVNKVAMKSRLWIVLIGIYICLGDILTPLIVIASCQIADELIVAPLKGRFRNKYTINKELDLRIGGVCVR